MAQTIKLRRSATAGAAPTTSQLELGEVAINTYDGKMYIKKSVGGTDSIVEIGSGLTPADAILEEYLYTATASQTAFSGNDDNSDFLSYTAGALQVFLNGILLDPETDYTATNGATITLTAAAALNDYLQIFAFKKKIGDSSITINTFTGNNSTTAYTLTLDPGDENNTRVFIDGVYQSKSNYTVSGTTLTFSSAPPSGTGIEVEIGNRAVSLDTASNLDLPDNVKLRLGTSQDLEIYHNSSNSVVADTGSGFLSLQSNGTEIALYDTANNANMGRFITGGPVNLFHNGNNKFQTTASGINVTGNIVVSGTVDGRDVASDGAAAVAALPRTGGAMTGAITTNSTFDGRDVATDGTKLDGIETGATADQTQSEINALGITATGLSGTPAISVANITTTGELRGPASLVIDPAGIGDNTGTVVIKGNLQVDGSQTTINSTAVSIDDLNLTLASGAANGTAANGAGITIDGASATLTYASAGDNWAFNKNLDVTGTGTFSGNVDINSDGGQLQFGADNDMQIYHNGAIGEINVPATDFTIDAGGDINLDAGGANINFNDDGTAVGHIEMAGQNLEIKSKVSDKDIIFKGNDGGSAVTALTLDMSEAGAATFNSNVIADGTASSSAPKYTFSGDTDTGLGYIGTNAVGLIAGGSRKFYVNDTTAYFQNLSGGVSILGNVAVEKSANPTFSVTETGAGAVTIQGTGSGGRVYSNSGNNLLLGANGQNSHLTINTSGNIGIGTTSPGDIKLKVHSNDSDDYIAIFKQTHASNLGTVQIDTPSDSNARPSRLDFARGGVNKWKTGMVYGDTTNGWGLSDATGSGTALQQTRFLVTPTGNVGIGTTAPGSTLDISHQITTDGIEYPLLITGKDSGNTVNQLISSGIGLQFKLAGNASSGDSLVGASIVAMRESDSDASSNTGLAFLVSQDDTTLDEVVRIKNNGNVGIGETNPDAKLHIMTASNGASTIGTASDELCLENSADCGLTIRSGSTSTGVISFADADDHNVGQVYYDHSTNDMTFRTNDSIAMTLDDGGKLGIGTINPTTHLSVASSGFTNTSTTGIPAIRAEGSYGGAIGLIDTKESGWYAQDNGDTLYQYVGRASGTAPNASIVMTYKSSGKVGIGTTSPGAKLDVESTGVAATPTVEITNTSSSTFNHSINAFAPNLTAAESNIFIIGRSGSTKNAGYIGYKYSSAGSNANVLTFGHWGSDHLMNLTGDGKLGIGTINPSAFLHVTGSEGSQYAGSFNNTSSQGWGLFVKGGADGDDYSLRVQNKDADELLAVKSNGNVGIGTTSPEKNLSIGSSQAEGIQFNFDTTNNYRNQILNYWNSNTDSRMDFNIGRSGGATPSTIMSVGYNSNVGIGTTAPDSPLHISNNGAPADDVTLLTLQNGNGTSDIATPDTFIDFVFKDTNTNVTPQARIAAHAGDGGDANTQILEGRGYLTFHTSHTAAESGVVAPPERLRIASSGNVGIGTSSPDTLLHVDGQAKFENNVILNENTPALIAPNGDLRIFTGGDESMRIGSSGNLSIGTTSSGYKLRVNSGTSNVSARFESSDAIAAIQFADNTGSAEIGASGNDFHIMPAGGAATAIFDSSGNLLVGKTSSGIGVVGTSVLSNGQLLVTADADNPVDFNRKTSDGVIANFRKDGTTVGSIGSNSGDSLFIQNSSTSGCGLLFHNSAFLMPARSGTVIDNVINLGRSDQRFKDLYLSGNVNADNFIGTNDADTFIAMTGSNLMRFFTGNSERMRIDSAGNVGIGTSSASTRLSVQGTSTSDVVTVLSGTTSNANVGMILFRDGASDFCGQITTNASTNTTSYNTSSDQRLKENIADADDAGSKIDAIQVRKFDWIKSGSHQDYGMIAQELIEVAPEAVSAPADSDEMMGVDYSKLVPMLIKEIQQLRNRVATLERE